MKVFVQLLCLAAAVVAKPQELGFSGSFSSGSSSGYSAPTVVSERTYTIKPQGASYSGASYGGASLGVAPLGVASYQGDAAYGGNYAAGFTGNYEGAYTAGAGAGYGKSLNYASGPVQIEQRNYQIQAQAPAYQAAAYYGGAAADFGAGASYNVNFQKAKILNAASLVGNVGYAAGFANGYSADASGFANGYSADASYAGAAENIDLSNQGETKVFKHVYAFAGPEEPAARARVVFKAPASNSKHYKLVFIKAPTGGAIVDSDITLPAQQEEKTQIYVLSKQQQYRPTIRVHTAQAAKHNKPEVLFVKYKNEAEAQAIASGAIAGQHGGIPAGGQIVSDGSVSVGAATGASYDAGFASGVSDLAYAGKSAYTGGVSDLAYGGKSVYSGAGLGSAANIGSGIGYGSRALVINGGSSGLSGAGFGSSTGSSFRSGLGSGTTSFSFGTGVGSGSGSGFGTRSAYVSSDSY